MAKTETVRFLFAGPAKVRVRNRKGVVQFQAADIYKCNSTEKAKAPGHPQMRPMLKSFAASVAKKLGLDPADAFDDSNPSEPWCHLQVATYYTYQVSHDRAIEINEAFQEYVREQLDPELKARRAFDRFVQEGRELGKADPEHYAQLRMQSVAVRHQFSGVVFDKVADAKNHIGKITNTEYETLFDADAASIRQSKGLPAKASIRPHLTLVEMAAVMLGEAKTIEDMEPHAALSGGQVCGMVRKNFEAVRRAIA